MDNNLICDYMDGVIIEKTNDNKLRCIFTDKILENYEIQSAELFETDKPKIQDFYELVLKRAKEDLQFKCKKHIVTELQSSNENSLVLLIYDDIEID
ncbi:negative regulator of genetic competence MecA [Kineothrix alysoides]|uniref:Negative regulator of genetic competence MecA n=1 Tax=Kineothrix alysoides TaxID=1469948 RepID=A0A4R1R3G1_9FIRM|nr:adaptor protein MecA [Kineothrix alysoides]TCL59976.1 negative regulator of genetic competence MecA [Kineothrix alysoides]